MDIDLIFKIAAVGIIVSILNQVLVRSGREEQATMTSLAALVVVLQTVASGIKAGDIIKAIAPICGGKGGGKPDSAMGGGTEVSKVDDALAAVDDLILSKLG